MMTVFFKELRDRRWSLLAYALITVLLVTMYTSLFPSIQAQNQSFDELFKSMPEGYQKAFGISQDSFGSLEGFLGIELFSLTMPLILMLLAISRAGNALAGEIERGTMRTLLSLPLSRQSIYVSKLAAAVASVLAVTLALLLAMVGVSAAANLNLDLGRVVPACALAALFGVALVGLAFAASATFSDRGRVYMVVGGFMLVQYIAHVVAGLQDNLSWIGRFSAFHYFDGVGIMSGAGVPASSWWVFGGIATVMAVIGLIMFMRRDIPA